MHDPTQARTQSHRFWVQVLIIQTTGVESNNVYVLLQSILDIVQLSPNAVSK